MIEWMIKKIKVEFPFRLLLKNKKIKMLKIKLKIQSFTLLYQKHLIIKKIAIFLPLFNLRTKKIYIKKIS